MASSASSVSSPVDSRMSSTPSSGARPEVISPAASSSETPEVASRVQAAASNVQDAPRRMSSPLFPPFQSLWNVFLMRPFSPTPDRDLALAELEDQSVSTTDQGEQPASDVVSERVAKAAAERGIPSSGASKDASPKVKEINFEKDEY